MHKLKNLWNYYRQNESLINLIIGVVGIALAIIMYFFPYHLSPRINYYLQQKSDVITLNKNIDQLTITYQDQDIRKQHLNLSLYKVRLINEGEDIREGDYAKEVPFGLKLNEGNILSAKIVESSDDYIKENLRPIVKDSSVIIFSEIVIEKDSYVDIEIIAIHKSDKTPSIQPIGKIAGQKEITFIEDEFGSSNFDWMGLFDGLLALGILVGSVLIVFYLIIGIYSYFEYKIRKNIILKFYNYPYKEMNKEQLIIKDLFISKGKKELRLLIQTLCDDNKISLEYQKEMARKKLIEDAKDLIKIGEASGEKLGFASPLLDVIDFFKVRNGLEIKDESIIIDNELKKELIVLKDFLVK